MSKGWLSRLVGSESAGAKSNAATALPRRKSQQEAATPTGDPFSGLRERGLVFLDDPMPAEPLPTEPPTATSRAELLIQLAAHEAAAQSPDALALLELLAESSDVVIRPLPAAAQASLAMCDDPNLTIRELAEKLSTDLALVQALLRTANSAAFCAGKDTVLSIGAALDRIGVASARAIIFANAVDGVLSRPGGHFNTMASAVWNHMLATAPLARALAPAFNADPEEAFAIALLHDIGKLVVFDRISTLRSTVRRDPELPASFVRDLLNQLHEPLGAAAMEAWGMGERSARAIGTHHRRTGDKRPNPLAEVVFVAEVVDHMARDRKTVELRRVWFDGRITASDTRVAEILRSREIAVESRAASL